SMGYEYVLDPSPEHLAMRSLFMLLPATSARALGLTVSTVASWMGFLRIAKPSASACLREPARAAICIDYGGLDVFVVTLVAKGGRWVPEAIAWRQLGRVDASPGAAPPPPDAPTGNKTSCAVPGTVVSYLHTSTTDLGDTRCGAATGGSCTIDL